MRQYNLKILLVKLFLLDYIFQLSRTIHKLPQSPYPDQYRRNRV